MTTYAQYRERMLLKEESFAPFLYLDTRGFLTSGLGYLYVRDAGGTEPGAAVQAHSLSLLADAGIQLTAAQQGAVDGLVRAMNSLDAAYNYPSFPKFAAFQGSSLGVALASHLALSVGKTASGAFTFRVDQAKTAAGMTPVEPLFADAAKHSAYLALYVRPYEDTIDRALAANGGLTLTDSQRVGLFSVAWNLPGNTKPVVAALAAGASPDAVRNAVKQGRGMVAFERIDLETALIVGNKDVADVFGS